MWDRLHKWYCGTVIISVTLTLLKCTVDDWIVDWHEDASSLAQFISSRSVYMKATDQVIDLTSIPLSVENLSFEDYSQVESTVLSFNLSPFSHLKSVTIGDDSFGSPIEFMVNGLNDLISIHVGMNSFTRSRYSRAERSNREFHVKNCVSLRELIIGRYSFSDYCVFDLSNLPQLRTISIGTVEQSNNFYYAYDVHLIGENEWEESLKDLPSLDSISVGSYSFGGCDSVRFESYDERRNDIQIFSHLNPCHLLATHSQVVIPSNWEVKIEWSSDNQICLVLSRGICFKEHFKEMEEMIEKQIPVLHSIIKTPW